MSSTDASISGDGSSFEEVDRDCERVDSITEQRRGKEVERTEDETESNL